MSVSDDGESKKTEAGDDVSVADSFFGYDSTPAAGAVSDDLSGTVLFVGTPLNSQLYAPLLHHHNVWDNSPDLVPDITNNSTFATAATVESPRDPLEGVPSGPHFPPAPAGSLVDRSREVPDFVVDGNEDYGKAKRVRLPTKTYVMDDDSL